MPTGRTVIAGSILNGTWVCVVKRSGEVSLSSFFRHAVHRQLPTIVLDAS